MRAIRARHLEASPWEIVLQTLPRSHACAKVCTSPWMGGYQYGGVNHTTHKGITAQHKAVDTEQMLMTRSKIRDTVVEHSRDSRPGSCRTQRLSLSMRHISPLEVAMFTLMSERMVSLTEGTKIAGGDTTTSALEGKSPPSLSTFTCKMSKWSRENTAQEYSDTFIVQ